MFDGSCFQLIYLGNPRAISTSMWRDGPPEALDGKVCNRVTHFWSAPRAGIGAVGHGSCYQYFYLAGQFRGSAIARRPSGHYPQEMPASPHVAALSVADRVSPASLLNPPATTANRRPVSPAHRLVRRVQREKVDVHDNRADADDDTDSSFVVGFSGSFVQTARRAFSAVIASSSLPVASSITSAAAGSACAAVTPR